MPERRATPARPRGRPLHRLAGLAVGAILLLGTAGTAWAPVAVAVPEPDEPCDAGAAASGVSEPCENQVGLDLGLLLILAGTVGVAGVAVLGAGYLVMRRRAAAPLDAEPLDAQEWWRCSNCGRSNVVGSARCHACGAWQR